VIDYIYIISSGQWHNKKNLIMAVFSTKMKFRGAHYELLAGEARTV
jgi:hypothetical protein